MELIAMHDHENNGYPNLALMKLSAWHKAQGDLVGWFDKRCTGYDKIYSSKIFTWTKTDPYLPKNSIIGGTGYDITTKLSDEVENMMPDYNLYNCDKSYGFLTRGCIRNCSWCFVPRKEGKIKEHQDIEDFLQHSEVVLMDNNVLAHSHGIEQIGKMAKMGLKVDFNQGLDARLIDNSTARLLATLSWKPSVRLACDSVNMIDPIFKAVKNLRWNNCTPRRYFCYVLVKNIDDALERIKFLKTINVDPFCQPYRNLNGDEPELIQKWFSRWVNHKALYNSSTWEDYYNERLLRV